jgi:hypothetical protein
MCQWWRSHSIHIAFFISHKISQSKIAVIIKIDNTKKNLFFVQGSSFVLDRGLLMGDPFINTQGRQVNCES